MWSLILLLVVNGHQVPTSGIPGNGWRFPSFEECMADGAVRAGGWAEPGTHGMFVCVRAGRRVQLRKAVYF